MTTRKNIKANQKIATPKDSDLVLFVIRFAEKDLHKVSSTIEDTDDVNLVGFNFVECGVVTADEEAVGHFKVDDGGEGGTAFEEIRKPTDALRDIPYCADGGLLAAQLFDDIRFDLL